MNDSILPKQNANKAKLDPKNLKKPDGKEDEKY